MRHNFACISKKLCRTRHIFIVYFRNLLRTVIYYESWYEIRSRVRYNFVFNRDAISATQFCIFRQPGRLPLQLDGRRPEPHREASGPVLGTCGVWRFFPLMQWKMAFSGEGHFHQVKVFKKQMQWVLFQMGATQKWLQGIGFKEMGAWWKKHTFKKMPQVPSSRQAREISTPGLPVAVKQRLNRGGQRRTVTVVEFGPRTNYIPNDRGSDIRLDYLNDTKIWASWTMCIVQQGKHRLILTNTDGLNNNNRLEQVYLTCTWLTSSVHSRIFKNFYAERFSTFHLCTQGFLPKTFAFWSRPLINQLV